MPPDQNHRLEELQALLGITFNNPELLLEALIHRSYSAENQGPNNERLEFLGDSVLALVVSAHLFRIFPTTSEGELARYRAVLVSNRTLAAVGYELGLDAFMLVGKGQALVGASREGMADRILSNTVEALIAAIYLDRGLDTAEQFMAGQILSRLPDVVSQGFGKDSKTWLQEVLTKLHAHPTYTVDGSGPDHAKSFHARVSWGGLVWGEGEGRSVKQAETAAARDALTKLEEEGLLSSEAERSEGEPEHGPGA